MTQNMVLHVAFGTKAFTTASQTHVRPLIYVDSHVDVEILNHSKILATS